MTEVVNGLKRLHAQRNKGAGKSSQNVGKRRLSLRGASLAAFGAVLLGLALVLGRAFFGSTKLEDTQAKVPNNTTAQPLTETPTPAVSPDLARPTPSDKGTNALSVGEKPTLPVESKPPTDTKNPNSTDLIELVLANPSAYANHRLSFDHLRLIQLGMKGRLGHRVLYRGYG